jgi:hypothetical protein
MQSSNKRILSGVVIAALVVPATARAGSCDFVLRWDEDAIRACIKEMKSEAWNQEMRLQTMSIESRILRTHLCMLATDIKTEAAAAVAADACAEVNARLAKKKAGSSSKKP